MASLGFGGKCAKYTLFIFNLIVALFGLALLVIGIFVLADSKVIHYIGIASDDSSFHLARGAAITVLILGVVSFIVGLVGCWGALCEKTSCLNCYACIAIVLILGEVIAIILAGVYHNELDEQIKKQMLNVLSKAYKDSPNNSIEWAWDHLQMEEHCCGVNGPYDWLNYNSNFTESVPVPKSCCIDSSTHLLDCYSEAHQNGTEKYVYHNGCAFYIKWMKSHMALLIAFAVILLLVEVVLVALTCCLKANISRGYEYV